MVADAFSVEIRDYIRDALKSGRFQNEQQLLEAAVRRFRDNELHLQQFRANLQGRIADLDEGHGIATESEADFAKLFAKFEA